MKSVIAEPLFSYLFHSRAFSLWYSSEYFSVIFGNAQIAGVA